MPTSRTVTICTRGITQLKRQSVTSSCTGISRPHTVYGEPYEQSFAGLFF
jgi:hypothetical protein